MDMVIPFKFKVENHIITIQESCWIDGKPYFTRRAIGEFLEYSDPQKAIDNIIDRNPHIDDPAWSTPLKLRGVEGDRIVERVTRVYGPIALQLIINKSNQPKALNYQVAVAHLVVAVMEGKLTPSKWSLKGDLVSATKQILSLPTGRKRGDLVRDLAEREGCSIATAYRRIYYTTGKRLHNKTRADKGTKKRGANESEIHPPLL